MTWTKLDYGAPVSCAEVVLAFCIPRRITREHKEILEESMVGMTRRSGNEKGVQTARGTEKENVKIDLLNLKIEFENVFINFYF